MKNFLRILLATIICLVFAVGLSVGGFVLFYAPTISADLTQKTGEVTNGASGYLYGIAQQGVPSKNMTESIDISTVSAKVPGGLQHPIGDLDDVQKQLDGTDYNVVYLQDMYSTWYYENASIEKMRQDGTYDWREFLKNDYLPKVKASVQNISSKPYSGKVVYCLYNECDNGVWFGETKQIYNDKLQDYDGAYGEYNEIGAQNFFEAWKMTYELVKSINPDALIGGPGFFEYESNKMRAFLTYCSENSCVPEIMIYHELNDYSIRCWNDHINDYRQLEAELGINELPIIITEYGRMCDNGMPGEMVKFISRIEDSKVYGDNAYWRLADNLNDVCADDNSPNSNWWLYRWYADMEGNTIKTRVIDLFNSNFENAYIKRKEAPTSWGFLGVVSMSEDESRVDAICGGCSGSASIKLKNIDKTALNGKMVKITVEESVFKGISGIVNTPVVKSITYRMVNSTLSIDLNKMDKANAYHITVEAVDELGEDYTDNFYHHRYEFEDGELLGNAYTYDSAYATTGEAQGMVGGMENEGDGVRLTFDVPEEGAYDLGLIFGNANDGVWDDNGRQNPDDRTDAVSYIRLDGEPVRGITYEGGELSELAFPNTIKSEYTDFMPLIAELEKGTHTLEITHSTGTIVLDSMLVDTHTDEYYMLDDADRSVNGVKSFLTSVKEDSYYIITSNKSYSVKINGNDLSFKEGDNVVYLIKGLNYIDVLNGERDCITLTGFAEQFPKGCKAYTANKMKLGGSARLKDDYITGISNKSGSAELTYYAENAGVYAIEIYYANNDEGGKHDYNVDLIEDYVTVTASGASQDVFCRSTYSWDTYKTVNCFVKLKKGNNKITFTNSGNTVFDSQPAKAPRIGGVTVYKICE